MPLRGLDGGGKSKHGNPGWKGYQLSWAAGSTVSSSAARTWRSYCGNLKSILKTESL